MFSLIDCERELMKDVVVELDFLELYGVPKDYRGS